MSESAGFCKGRFSSATIEYDGDADRDNAGGDELAVRAGAGVYEARLAARPAHVDVGDAHRARADARGTRPTQKPLRTG